MTTLLLVKNSRRTLCRAALGRGVRKIRMAIGSKGKGKSGGACVLTLTVLVSEDADVTLLTIYDKDETDNVSDEYIRWLISEAGK